MKKIIFGLKRDQQVKAFAFIGLLLVLFPAHAAGIAPYLLGVSLILYAAINIFISLKYPDAQTHLGGAVVKGIIGIVILLMKGNSISVLGVIWGVTSLHEVAAEIDECYKTKHISKVSLISMIISVVLAAMLMMDPFKHFNMHVRILGLEIITTVFIRRKKELKEQKM